MAWSWQNVAETTNMKLNIYINMIYNWGWPEDGKILAETSRHQQTNVLTTQHVLHIGLLYDQINN